MGLWVAAGHRRLLFIDDRGRPVLDHPAHYPGCDRGRVRQRHVNRAARHRLRRCCRGRRGAVRPPRWSAGQTGPVGHADGSTERSGYRARGDSVARCDREAVRLSRRARNPIQQAVGRVEVDPGGQRAGGDGIRRRWATARAEGVSDLFVVGASFSTTVSRTVDAVEFEVQRWAVRREDRRQVRGKRGRGACEQRCGREYHDEDRDGGADRGRGMVMTHAPVTIQPLLRPCKEAVTLWIARASHVRSRAFISTAGTRVSGSGRNERSRSDVTTASGFASAGPVECFSEACPYGCVFVGCVLGRIRAEGETSKGEWARGVLPSVWGRPRSSVHGVQFAISLGNGGEAL